MKLSKEQIDIVEFVKTPADKLEKKNLIIDAGAGSGKSTILAHSIVEMQGSVLALAFTKKNAVQLQIKLENKGLIHAKASTFHAEGLNQYRLSYPKMKVDSKNQKVGSIVFKYCDTEELSPCYSFLKELVSKAKQYGIGIEWAGLPSIDDTQGWLDIINHHEITLPNSEVDMFELIEIAKSVLKESNRDKLLVDFDDMIYLPALLKLSNRKYDWVLVDEAQDTNVVRKIILPLWSKETTRYVFVGDRRQAIMGFTGAQNDSMDLLKEMFNCHELPLYTCYRCAKNVIKSAQEYNSNITPFEDNADGIVDSMTYDKFSASIVDLKLDGKMGIICRNNAPLTSLAFSIIRKGIGCRIEGKDIGRNLKQLATKWKKVKTLNEFTEKLTEHFNREFEKAKSRIKLQALEDKLETMIILIERCLELGKNDIYSLQNLIDSMFSDSDDRNLPNIVTLSSIHKAKGLEWKRVFVYGENQLQPSRYATQQWEIDQEMNLIYVARTRAIEHMTFITDVPLRSRNEED